MDSTITCVNVGDSRCVAGYCTSDQVFAFPLSIDQTPVRDVELGREMNHRMNVLVLRRMEVMFLHLPIGCLRIIG